jgi:hypothetical protein
MEFSITLRIGPNFGLTPCICCPPYLAAAGHPKEALCQIDGYRNALFDRHTGLFSHKWDDEKQALFDSFATTCHLTLPRLPKELLVLIVDGGNQGLT